MDRLLVLGNGFDLACGLKSSYSDFFAYRFNELFEEKKKEKDNKADVFQRAQDYRKDNLKKLINIAIHSNIYSCNFWDIVFLLQSAGDAPLSSGSNWCDVEVTIKKVVTAAFFDSSEKPYIKEKISDYLTTDTDALIMSLKQLYSKRGRQQLTIFLLNELNKFEKNFSEYIMKSKNSNSEYQARVGKVLDELLTPMFLLEWQHQKKSIKHTSSILSFNYSLDKSDDFVYNMNIDKWINIHGYVGNEKGEYANSPIFGIDSNNINESDPRIVFTKTFRVANGIVNYIQPLPKQVDSISFYGHSLSEADYSYFESLFDMYHVYSSKVSLYFYFGAFSPESSIKWEEKNSKLRRQMTVKIYNLFSHYGKSLKENHGANLFHRLLLENRIHVIDRRGDRR